jgi:N-glycosylase/DNA lyase
VLLSHPDFNLEATLESGQVFGFTRHLAASFRGQIYGRAVTLSQNGPRLNIVGKIPRKEIERYFDLDRDLAPIYSILEAEKFPLTPALKGLRLIRQDHWEALACFIISSNNNVKRIQGIWQNLSRRFDGFPSALQVAKTHERILRELGLGYRAPFLLSTARFIAANPVCLDVIRQSDYEEARARVLAFPGIGPKVADCVLLYGFHKLEAFPVDVWIARVMRKHYFRNRRVSEAKIHAFARKKWAKNAGYLQQYFFHTARMGMYTSP